MAQCAAGGGTAHGPANATVREACRRSHNNSSNNNNNEWIEAGASSNAIAAVKSICGYTEVDVEFDPGRTGCRRMTRAGESLDALSGRHGCTGLDARRRATTTPTTANTVPTTPSTTATGTTDDEDDEPDDEPPFSD